MYITLIIVHLIACLGIIGFVLLQSGKGADIGSAFGGGTGGQAVFGSMGTPTILTKITTGIAIAFTITSFSLALLGGERGSSVVREAPAPPPASTAPPASTPPSSSAPAPAAPAAPTSTPPAQPR